MSAELALAAEAPVTLFRTDDPGEVIARATETANALAAVVKAKNLTVRIGQGEHVKVEGWTMLGSLLGVFPVCVWSRRELQGLGDSDGLGSDPTLEPPSLARPLQHNTEPVPRCVGCRKRAPWCSCGMADYRL